MRFWIGLVALLLVPAGAAAAPQSSDNVLVVINEASPVSIQIGEYYARKRAVAQDHVVRIKTGTVESIQRFEYERTIEQPIGEWLSTRSLQDRILYVVLTKGVPLRIIGVEGREGTVSSVDSELTLLYRKLLGLPSPIVGRVPNPYFLGVRPLADAKPFTRFLYDTYLVTRLDAFTADEALKLVDRAQAPSRDGKIVLDQKAAVADRGGDDWLQEAATRLRATAFDRVFLESSSAVASVAGPVLGYYSWGSNDRSNQLRQFGLTFADGAIGGMFVSTDGRTFNEPPATWKPSDPDGRGPRFGGSFQSLSGDLIRDGITGVSGHVAEPLLDATIRPQILFPAYLSGFNLAESFYLGMPYLSWQTVVIGDPLCAPFPRATLPADQLFKPVDPDTEMPGLFAERRLAAISRAGLNTDALKIMLKIDVLVGRDRRADVESLLIRAVELEPRLTGAHLRLAEFYEERKEYDKSIDRYRRVIAAEPQNVVALNNIAYALAEHAKAPKEALPLAEKALRLVQDPALSAVIADTLGWIHHLLGDDRAAAPLVERAVAGTRNNVDVLIHAAIVHAALNDLEKARAELAAADKLDPKLNERADVKVLRDKLRGGRP